VAQIELTDADHGSTVAARPGDQLVIELDEIPSSGHRWTVDDLGAGMHGPVQDEFRSGGEAFGAGGRRRLSFEVRSPGDARISLVRRQEWEPGQPSGRFEVTLHVTPAA
jgi:predicted secreted protein